MVIELQINLLSYISRNFVYFCWIMEKQSFTKYTFTDQRTGDVIRYMDINDKLTDHNVRLKKMQVQIFNEMRIPVSSITYVLTNPSN